MTRIDNREKDRFDKEIKELSAALLNLMHYQNEAMFCLIGIIDHMQKEINEKESRHAEG